MPSCDGKNCENEDPEECVGMISNGHHFEDDFEEMGIDVDWEGPPVCFTLCRECITEKHLTIYGVCSICDKTMIDDGFCFDDDEYYCRECINDDIIRTAVDIYYSKEYGKFSFISWDDLWHFYV